MKENPTILVLTVLLVISISFLVSVVSASDATTTKTNFVYTSYSADDLYAVKSTSDNNIYFFDNSNSKNAIPWTYNIGNYIGSIAISPNGKYVTVGSGGGLIYLFDQNGNVLWKNSFGDAPIQSISFSADSSFIDASNSMNQAFYIDLTGKLAVRPTFSAVPTILPTTNSPIPTTPPSSDYLLPSIGTIVTIANSYFWPIIGVIILFVILVILYYPLKKVSPTNPTGIIYAKSIPAGAEIYLDNNYLGQSPKLIGDVPPGIHTVKATLKGYDSDTQRITINAGQTFIYSPSLRRIPPPPPKPKPQPKSSFEDLINQLGAKAQQDREEAQKQLIILVNTEGKSAIKQIIKELEKQPSGIKREIVNLLYYLSKESHEGQKVTEELINALTYSSPDVKWLIIQTLGRLKDKRALHALEVSVSDTDFLVKYWAIVSLKNIQES